MIFNSSVLRMLCSFDNYNTMQFLCFLHVLSRLMHVELEVTRMAVGLNLLFKLSFDELSMNMNLVMFHFC